MVMWEKESFFFWWQDSKRCNKVINKPMEILLPTIVNPGR